MLLNIFIIIFSCVFIRLLSDIHRRDSIPYFFLLFYAKTVRHLTRYLNKKQRKLLFKYLVESNRKRKWRAGKGLSLPFEYTMLSLNVQASAK